MTLFILMFLFWLGLKITGAFLAAAIWLCIQLPLAIMAFVFGLLLCCTILLIPIGLGCFKLAFGLLFPAFA